MTTPKFRKARRLAAAAGLAAAAATPVAGLVIAAVAPSALRAEDAAEDAVAWTFEGNTNRAPVAVVASANAATLRTRLSSEAVSEESITTTTRPDGAAVIIR